MHEASLVSALAENLLELKRREGARRILKFKVEIGELSGVDPEAFRLAYEVLRDNLPDLREAEMELSLVPARFRCENCGASFPGDYLAPCPDCGDLEKVALAGEELLLREVEMEV